jgi:hypothetical protein
MVIFSKAVQSGTDNTEPTQHAHDSEAAHPMVHIATAIGKGDTI